MMNLSPSASCEGHVDQGITAPWVEFQAPDQPEERFVKEKDITQEVADKYGISFEDVKTMTNFEAWQEAYEKMEKNEETFEYKKWREKNEKLKEKIKNLLNEFYQDRKVPSNIQIKMQEENPDGSFRINNGGEDYILFNEKEEMDEKEKKELKERIENYREEMSSFAKFLKDKYFEEDNL